MLELGSDGNTNCWKTEVIDSYQAFLNSECIWFHALVRAAHRRRSSAPIREFLDNYVIEQKKHGRFPRPLNNYLYDVDGWLKRNEVVDDDNKAMLTLAFAFLAVCLVNTVGLLLAKFLNAAPIAGVRRALGASRRDIFWQHLTESGVVALAGGIVGGLLGLAGVWALRAWYGRFVDDLQRVAAHSTKHELPDRGRHRGRWPASWPGCIRPGVSGARRPPPTSRCNRHGNPTHFLGADAQSRGRHPRGAADRDHAGHRRQRRLLTQQRVKPDRPADRAWTTRTSSRSRCTASRRTSTSSAMVRADLAMLREMPGVIDAAPMTQVPLSGGGSSTQFYSLPDKKGENSPANLLPHRRTRRE